MIIDLWRSLPSSPSALRLVAKRVKAALPRSLDQHQYAYRENRSTEDAIVTALHTTLTHLDKKETYVRLLFIDYSSAFNTIKSVFVPTG